MRELLALILDRQNQYALTWWRYCDGEWSRSHSVTGPWVLIAFEDVPREIVGRVRAFLSEVPGGCAVN